MTRRIIAMGGGGFMMEKGRSRLDEFFLESTRVKRPRVCFLPTATGDAEEVLERFYKAFSQFRCIPTHLSFFHKPRKGALRLDELEKGLLNQDAIYVSGGNTLSMLAVWRGWGFDRILRKAWKSGILLGGMSAGAICWFNSGATDSILGPGKSSPLRCLGFLPGSCSPHFDGERDRRPAFRRLIARGELPSGIGIDDGAAVLYHGRTIAKVVSARPGAGAYRVFRKARAVIVEPIPAVRI